MAQQNQNQQDLREILQIRRDKLAALQEAGRNPFEITRYDVTHHAQEVKDQFDQLEGQTVSLAGRLMSKRGMGKVSFCDLKDKSGRIQIYARKDEMDEEAYDRFRKYDIGDIVGVKGDVFRTQKGEMSIRAHEITLLSKSLQPLPEKFHGLTDKELRYRQRYVDLIMNPESQRNFEIQQVRSVSAPVSGQYGLHGGGDPRAQPHCRRCQRPALHHPPQRSGHRYVYAHRYGVAPEAAHRGRSGASV